MTLKLYEFLLGVLLGLLPLFVQLFFNYKAYKRSQIDNYSVILYGKQYDVYSNIYLATEKLNRSSQEIFISQKKAYYPEVITGLTLEELEESFFSDLEELKDYVKNNSMILPNDFLRVVYEYIQLSNIIRNTIIRSKINDEALVKKNLHRIEDVSDLDSFVKNHFDLFIKVLRYIKTLIGTEHLSKEAIKYLKSKKSEEDFLYYTDRQANLE